MMKGIDMPYSTEKGEHTAFFYGTLMAPDVLFRITMGTSKPPTEQAARLTIQPAILYDYSRKRVQFCDYPGIIPQAKHTVRGTYVTGLTDHDIFCLDAFEGDQYTRTKVEVRLLEKEKAGDETIDDVAKHAAAGNLTAHELVDLLKVGLKEGKSRPAETYVFTAGLSFLETSNGDWDFEEFVTEKMAGRWADNSEEYKERDEADEAANGHDPTGGRGINSKPKVDLGPKGDWDESGDSPPGRVW